MRLAGASGALAAAALAWAVLAPGGQLQAQSQRDTERRLESVRKELNDIARERRQLEGERGTASRRLREADERVAGASRALNETEAALRREQETLDELGQRRDEMRQRLDGQRKQLAALLRASYALGADAPLKALLAQERIADAGRMLAYHRYLQRDHAARIVALSTELNALVEVEREIDQRMAQLEAAREEQRRQIAALRLEHESRAQLVSELEERYQDRDTRAKALGQDVRALERLLANLRAAAQRAEAERRAAAERAAAAARRGTPPATPPKQVASAPPLKVGGLGWPVTGDLLARYGGRTPDGRTSSGVLIGAAAGTPVTAVADGDVVFAEWMTGYGLILILDHGNGYMSLYAHNDALLRNAGDRVKRGDPVARVGSSGGHGRPALYFELRRDGRPVDPSSWLQRR